ncbi:MAG: endonuclease NucS domain-containing protein [Thermodesulfobacteriota bacterium]
MDAILFSANTDMVTVDDAVRHLTMHEELYWEVGFRIIPDQFSFPILGYIHITKGQVEYKVIIRKIIPFSSAHYEDEEIARQVKPEPWRKEWEENLITHKYPNGIRNYPWKYALVMTDIEPFSYDTCQFLKYDSSNVKKATQSYIRVQPPTRGPFSHLAYEGGRNEIRSKSTLKNQRFQIAEINLEEFVVHQLDQIESGLRLEKRQLSTAAGRLDLLCRDQDGQYVVIELKRSIGTDQVVGQILRYMGWVGENFQTDKVRGIIIVGKKDQALSYAVKAVANIQVKEFKILIE